MNTVEQIQPMEDYQLTIYASSLFATDNMLTGSPKYQKMNLNHKYSYNSPTSAIFQKHLIQ